MFPDRLIIEADKVLRTLWGEIRSRRPVPGEHEPEEVFSEAARRHVSGLMRVNHSGEVCAQALYQGQSLTARSPGVREALQEAAREEGEHLAWTGQRIEELGGRRSLLNPLWYAGALGLGMLAGRIGDRWSLGFLAETERQVEAHLARHLDRLPAEDLRTRMILEQMKADEIKHAGTAVCLGAADLPASVRLAMRATAKVMTGVAYHL